MKDGSNFILKFCVELVIDLFLVHTIMDHVSATSAVLAGKNDIYRHKYIHALKYVKFSFKIESVQQTRNIFKIIAL